MRELTIEELDLISGGSGSEAGDDNEDIVITGSPYPPGAGGWPSFPPPYYPPPPSGGGGGPPSFFPPPPPQTPCERDAMEDTLAQSLEAMIKAQPDWNEREYGAMIVRYADGEYGITGLSRGETVAEAQARAAAAGETGFAPETHFPSVPAGAVVVAVIHNHPDVGYDNAQDIQNRYPSYNPGASGDYNSFDSLVGTDPRFTTADQFTQYILGPDGVLREYGQLEGHLNPSNDPRPGSRSDLTADRPCS